MNMQTAVNSHVAPDNLSIYLDTLGRLERLYRLLLDVVKDEFERLGLLDINSVQGLLLFNIGEQEVTAGELKSRGCYQSSNVSYNQKKLVDSGYMHHEKCAVDRRSVRVRLTQKGRKNREALSDMFARQAIGLVSGDHLDSESLNEVNGHLRLVERYWADQIRYIY